MIDVPKGDGRRWRRRVASIIGKLGRYDPASMTRRWQLLPIVCALLGGWLLLQAFGTVSVNMDFVTLRLRLRAPGAGLTEASIPPVGRILASTHTAPIDFVVTLREVSLDALGEFLGFSPPADLELSQSVPPDGVVPPGAARADLLGAAEPAELPPFPAERVAEWVQPELHSALLRFAIRTALVIAIGGGLGALLVGRRRLRTFLEGAGVALLALAIVGTPAILTYRTAGFAAPRYEGILEAAPWMVGAVQESLEQVDELGAQLSLIAANLYRLFSQIQTLEPLTSRDSDFVLLHVSDIHNNPAAFDFIESVVVKFGVGAVVDTGDLTDWGTPLEARIIDRVGRVGVPYIFVSGNHETPGIVAELQALEGVRVLGGVPDHFAISATEIDGLRIAGIADPGAGQSSPGALDPEHAARMAQAIEEKSAASQLHPDVFAVHNFRVGQALSANVAPVILYGHDHRLHVEITEDQAFIDAGTTGAAGIRGLGTPEGVPYTMAILYFDRTGAGWRLKAIDTLSISGLEGRFTLERYAPRSPGQVTGQSPM